MKDSARDVEEEEEEKGLKQEEVMRGPTAGVPQGLCGVPDPLEL